MQNSSGQLPTRVEPRNNLSSLILLRDERFFILLKYCTDFRTINGGFMEQVTMDKIVSLSKSRGFIFPGSVF